MKRIVLRIVLAVAGVLILLVVLAPTLVSLGPARRTILGIVNASLDGTLDIRSWSFGWVRGQAVRGLDFKRRDDMAVRVESATVSSGLLRFLARTWDLGTIRVINPQVLAVWPPAPAPEPKEGAPAPQPQPEPAPAPEPAGAPPAAPGEKRPPFLPGDIKGTITIQDGRFEVKGRDTADTLAVDTLNASLKIDGLANPVTFAASGRQGGASGDFSIEGSVQGVKEAIADPNRAVASLTAKIADWDLAPIRTVSGPAGAPDINGRLNMTLNAGPVSMGELSTQGSLKLDDLRLSGGPLGKDTPSLGNLALDVDVGMKGGDLSVRKATLDSSFAKLNIKSDLAGGAEGPYPKGTVEAEATVDLAFLAQQFATTLKMREDMRLTGGTFGLAATAKSDARRIEGQCRLSLRDVTAQKGAETISLSAPVEVALAGNVTDGSPYLDNLTIASSFLKASGKGGIDDLSATFEVNLAEALREGSKFVAADQYAATGQLTGSIEARALSATSKKIDFKLSLPDLMLAGLTPEPIEPGAIRSECSATVNLGPGSSFQDVTDLSAMLSLPAAGVQVSAEKLIPPKDQPMPSISGLRWATDVHLDRLTELLRSTAILAASPDLKGVVKVRGEGALEPGAVVIQSLSVAGSDLLVRVEGKELSEPSLNLSLQGRADLGKRELSLESLAVKWSTGEVTSPRFRLLDWARGAAGMEGSVHASANMEGLMTQIGGFAPLPERSRLSGTVTADLELTPEGGAQAAALNTRIEQFAFTSPAGARVDEPRATLATAVSLDSAKGSVAVRSLALESSPLSLQCKGALEDMRGAKQVSLDGDMTVDFHRVAELLAAFAGLRIEMEGKQKRPFTLRTSLAQAGPAGWLAATEAAAGLAIDRLKALGIDATGASLDTRIEKGKLTATIDSQVNQGRLSLKPIVSAESGKTVLVVTGPAPMLTGVKITGELADQLLARAHPIFRGSGAAAGQIDLTLKQCRVPLDSTAAKTMNVAGDVALKDVVLTAGGLLKEILTLTKVEGNQVAIPNQTISFACRDGRVEPSPLKIKAGEYTMTLGGTVGLDGTLDYSVQTPVTRHMVGEEAYPYVKDAPVTIVIGGTVDNPVISRDSFTRSVKDIVQTGTKNVIKEKGTKLLEKLLEQNLPKKQ